MDLDDLLDGIEIGGRGSDRVRRILRIAFGLLGTGLSAAGAWHVLGYDAGLPLRLAGAVFFLFLGAFWLVNVTLARRASWPWKGVVGAFVLLFLVRILLGA